MKVHELKTDPDMFYATRQGIKNFDLRQDDGRNFEVGDVLRLKETKYTGEEMKEGSPLEYTKREFNVMVMYILRGPRYGLPEGWVIMGHRPAGQSSRRGR